MATWTHAGTSSPLTGYAIKYHFVDPNRDEYFDVNRVQSPTQTASDTRSNSPTGHPHPDGHFHPVGDSYFHTFRNIHPVPHDHRDAIEHRLFSFLTPTATETFIPTGTATGTSTETATPTNSNTGTNTPTSSPTATRTATPILTPSYTSTWAPTFTPSVTPDAFHRHAFRHGDSFQGESGIVNLSQSFVFGPVVNVLPPAYAGASDIRVEIFTTAFRKVWEETFSNAPPGIAIRVELKDKRGIPLADGLYYLVVTVDGQRLHP